MDVAGLLMVSLVGSTTCMLVFIAQVVSVPRPYRLCNSRSVEYFDSLLIPIPYQTPNLTQHWPLEAHL